MASSIERNTKQREAIWEAFSQAKRPLSPPEVLAAASQIVKRLSISTVYRTINNLLEDQLLEQVHLPGEPARYEPAGLAHHHHFWCERCGRAYDIPGCSAVLNQQLPAGFKVAEHEVVFYGVCANCSALPPRPRRRNQAPHKA